MSGVRRSRGAKVTPEFLARVKELLNEGKLTQKEIARVCFTSTATVCYIKQGLYDHEEGPPRKRPRTSEKQRELPTPNVTDPSLLRRITAGR